MYQLGHNPVSFGKDYGLDYGKKNGGFLYLLPTYIINIFRSKRRRNKSRGNICHLGIIVVQSSTFCNSTLQKKSYGFKIFICTIHTHLYHKIGVTLVASFIQMNHSKGVGSFVLQNSLPTICTFILTL